MDCEKKAFTANFTFQQGRISLCWVKKRKTIATQQAHKDWSKKDGKQEKFIYLVDNKLILSVPIKELVHYLAK